MITHNDSFVNCKYEKNTDFSKYFQCFLLELFVMCRLALAPLQTCFGVRYCAVGAFVIHASICLFSLCRIPFEVDAASRYPLGEGVTCNHLRMTGQGFTLLLCWDSIPIPTLRPVSELLTPSELSLTYVYGNLDASSNDSHAP